MDSFQFQNMMEHLHVLRGLFRENIDAMTRLTATLERCEASGAEYKLVSGVAEVGDTVRVCYLEVEAGDADFYSIGAKGVVRDVGEHLRVDFHACENDTFVGELGDYYVTPGQVEIIKKGTKQ
jgi:hypothetical protein